MTVASHADTLYKVLDVDGSPFHGGTGRWFVPRGKRPGAWMPKISPLVMCQSGYHVVKLERLIDWLGPQIFEVECRGEQLTDGNKIVAEQARLIRPLANWNDRTCRLLAADCAEHVLHIFEAKARSDDRPRAAIEAARAYARGEIDAAAQDAAWDAAWNAARDAAWAAAWDAAGAAAYAAGAAAYAARDAAYAARDAAWAAAQDAAQDAAGAAAGAAAWAAERQWQSDRLMQYLWGSS